MMNAPLPIPSATLSLWYLYLGWGVIFASLAWITTRKSPAPIAVALWVGLPLIFSVPEYSPAYWLGLAFQSPSLVSVALCACLIAPCRFAPRQPLVLATIASGIGWILLLDSFAVWPIEIYTLGFQAGIAGGIVLLALLISLEPATIMLASGLVLYVVLRLPTGNVWDAVLDPLLWLWSQWYVIKTVAIRMKYARKAIQ
ncbi:MAG: hypothetical protein RLZZ495_646 [Pseudomonadota bacterium]